MSGGTVAIESASISAGELAETQRGCTSPPDISAALLTAESPVVEDTLRSIHSSQPTSVRFTNETCEPVSIVWIDFNGERVLYATLAAGASYVQLTFVTHPWIVIGQSSGPLAIFHPATELAEARIAIDRNLPQCTVDDSGCVGGRYLPEQAPSWGVNDVRRNDIGPYVCLETSFIIPNGYLAYSLAYREECDSRDSYRGQSPPNAFLLIAFLDLEVASTLNICGWQTLHLDIVAPGWTVVEGWFYGQVDRTPPAAWGPDPCIYNDPGLGTYTGGLTVKIMRVE